MEKRTTVSTFPNPPPFFELYAKEETSLPPPPPINKPYFTFGEYHQFPNDSPPLLHEKITNENGFVFFFLFFMVIFILFL